MSDSPNLTIDYSQVLHDGMLFAIRSLLQRVKNDGLPGDHYFYITFASQHKDVKLPKHIKKQYPQEMSIVLQHQFWNLEVDEDGFSVSLSFSGKVQRLYVPFKAMTSFSDPSANFGLQLQPKPTNEENNNENTNSTENETENQMPPQTKNNPNNVVTLDKFRQNKSN